MQTEVYPIIEFDTDRRSLIEPNRIFKDIGAPEHAVVCFFKEIIDDLLHQGRLKVIANRRTEDHDRPLFEMEFQGRRLAVFHPGVGAPVAAGLLEESIALGCRKFIACGGCGVLDRQITAGRLLIPTTALRDEGTSYHYLPPGREVSASAQAVSAIEKILQKHAVSYKLVKVWTTDAIYRETLRKIQLRKNEGCLAVEMEAAAFFAVAQFRGVPFGQILYAGDDISGEEWDSRNWQAHTGVRQNMFWLAAEACLEL